MNGIAVGVVANEGERGGFVLQEVVEKGGDGLSGFGGLRDWFGGGG